MEQEKKPRINFTTLIIGIAILILSASVVFLSIKLAFYFQSDLCIIPTSQYIVNCTMNNRIIQVTVSQDQLQQALNDKRYNCSVNAEYHSFPIDFCNPLLNRTQYRVAIKPA